MTVPVVILDQKVDRVTTTIPNTDNSMASNGVIQSLHCYATISATRLIYVIATCTLGLITA